MREDDRAGHKAPGNIELRQYRIQLPYIPGGSKMNKE